MQKFKIIHIKKTPSFEAKINHGSWKYFDEKGHTCWPTIELEDLKFDFESLSWLNFYEDVCLEETNCIGLINKYIEINYKFSSTEEIKNYLFAFLLNGFNSDKYFTKKVNI